MTSTGTVALRRFLRSSAAFDVLDDAVCGCLPTSTVAELIEDFEVSASTFRTELNAALEEGF